MIRPSQETKEANLASYQNYASSLAEENKKTIAEVTPISDEVFRKMPNPTKKDLKDPTFNAIWNVIKNWDVNVPECYAGYRGANGSHVKMILNELRKIK